MCGGGKMRCDSAAGNLGPWNAPNQRAGGKGASTGKTLTPAPLHWVVIVRFTKVDFPVQARQPIEANGGKCIAAWECAYGNNFVGVLLAEEPSGDSGELERHLSVSASTACIRRMPKRKEMRAALDAAGMSGEAQMQVGNNVIHIFQPLFSSR